MKKKPIKYINSTDLIANYYGAKEFNNAHRRKKPVFSTIIWLGLFALLMLLLVRYSCVSIDPKSNTQLENLENQGN